MLSARAARALEVLRAGGRFRYALEAGYRGREKFRMRLLDARRAVVVGIGYQAKVELEQAGLLQWEACARSSAWPQEWVLRAEALAV